MQKNVIIQLWVCANQCFTQAEQACRFSLCAGPKQQYPSVKHLERCLPPFNDSSTSHSSTVTAFRPAGFSLRVLLIGWGTGSSEATFRLQAEPLSRIFPRDQITCVAVVTTWGSVGEPPHTPHKAGHSAGHANSVIHPKNSSSL